MQQKNINPKTCTVEIKRVRSDQDYEHLYFSYRDENRNMLFEVNWQHNVGDGNDWYACEIGVRINSAETIHEISRASRVFMPQGWRWDTTPAEVLALAKKKGVNIVSDLVIKEKLIIDQA